MSDETMGVRKRTWADLGVATQEVGRAVADTCEMLESWLDEWRVAFGMPTRGDLAMQGRDRGRPDAGVDCCGCCRCRTIGDAPPGVALPALRKVVAQAILLPRITGHDRDALP